MQHWRAILTAASGSNVSSNVAPTTAPVSVTSNWAFKQGLLGFWRFNPIEIFYQELSNSVMGALLIAIAAVTSMRPGIPHLGSVATHPEWRGRGLSRDLCARLTRDALAEGADLPIHGERHQSAGICQRGTHAAVLISRPRRSV